MAAVLTIFSGDEDKRKAYMSICENHLGIQMATPDINESGEGFTPDAENHRILYGLKSIKSVGDAAIPDLLANRPYASLEDVMNKVPKKAFNKRIGENLIKAGAFDFIDKNRFALLNQFHELRRDKGIDPYDTSTYDEDACIEMEEEVFGKSITHKPWWDAIKDGTSLREIPAEVLDVTERTDKRGGLMAFAELLINKCHVRALIWSSKYSKCHAAFDMNLGTRIQVSGTKQAPRKTGEPSTLVVSNALRIITPQAIPA